MLSRLNPLSTSVGSFRSSQSQSRPGANADSPASAPLPRKRAAGEPDRRVRKSGKTSREASPGAAESRAGCEPEPKPAPTSDTMAENASPDPGAPAAAVPPELVPLPASPAGERPPSHPGAAEDAPAAADAAATTTTVASKKSPPPTPSARWSWTPWATAPVSSGKGGPPAGSSSSPSSTPSSPASSQQEPANAQDKDQDTHKQAGGAAQISASSSSTTLRTEGEPKEGEQHPMRSDKPAEPASTPPPSAAGKPAAGWSGYLPWPLAATQPAAQAADPPAAPTTTGPSPDETAPAVTKPAEPAEPAELAEKEEKPSRTSTSSWFGFLSSNRTEPTDGADSAFEISTESPPSAEPGQPDGSVQKKDIPKGSWAFWSLWNSGPSGSTTTGKLAVAGEGSETDPENVKLNLKQPKSASSLRRKRSSPTFPDFPADQSKVVPAFDTVFPHTRRESTLQRTRSYYFEDSTQHPHVSKTLPPRIRKVVVVGVHGWFPTGIAASITGGLQGTSILLATKGAEAVDRWLAQNNQRAEIQKISLDGGGIVKDRGMKLWELLENWGDQIQTADLVFFCSHSQGVPVCSLLVQRLFKDEHSYIKQGARVAICGMAGINMGPYSNYQSQFWNNSGQELFNFSEPDSSVSVQYREALEQVLSKGVKVSFIGSVDDPVVALDSSTFMGVSHPHIFRAAFLDTRRPINNSAFLNQLLELALKAVNRGASDRGFIRELSPWLCPSFVSETRDAMNGHSNLYKSPAVYDLALRFALETSFVGSGRWQTQSWQVSRMVPAIPIPAFVRHSRPPEINPDIYPTKETASMQRERRIHLLVWSLRGLIEQSVVRDEMAEAVRELSGLLDGSALSKELKEALTVLKHKL